MIRQEEVKKAVAEFLKNPYWNRYYSTAPSDNARKRIELKFYIGIWGGAAQVTDEQYVEAVKRMNEIEDAFTVEDCRHALRYNGHNPGMLRWIKKIKELGG